MLLIRIKVLSNSQKLIFIEIGQPDDFRGCFDVLPRQHSSEVLRAKDENEYMRREVSIVQFKRDIRE